MNQEMIDKFNAIKEIMKDYTNICECKCDDCPFNIIVGYKWGDCEIKLCDAIDEILE